MNERVTELIWKADQYSLSNLSRGRDSEFFHTIAMNKLTELIVQECLFIIDDERKSDIVNRTELWKQVKQHFGVGE